MNKTNSKENQYIHDKKKMYNEIEKKNEDEQKMIGKCERRQIRKEGKMLKKNTNTHDISQKIMKGIKTTYNKIVT